MKGKMRGAEEMRNKLKKIAEEFPKRLAAAIYQEAQIEMMEAKRRTPVSPLPAPKGVVPGTLRNSGTVHPPEIRGKIITVAMTFGGAASDYAVIQHENPDYLHTTGQWKFLESVLDESRPFMAERIARRIHFDKMRL